MVSIDFAASEPCRELSETERTNTRLTLAPAVSPAWAWRSDGQPGMLQKCQLYTHLEVRRPLCNTTLSHHHWNYTSL